MSTPAARTVTFTHQFEMRSFLGCSETARMRMPTGISICDGRYISPEKAICSTYAPDRVTAYATP